MDVLATTCLAVIAVAAVVIAWTLIGLAAETRRTRRLLEQVTRHLGASPEEKTVRAPDVDTRSWVPADA